MSDFLYDYIESSNVVEENAGLYNTVHRYLVKIDETVDNGEKLPHGFIIKNIDKSKQKTIEYAPHGLEIAYCKGWDGSVPKYQIFGYTITETFNKKLLESINDNKKSKKKNPMYLVFNDKLKKLLNETKTENVTNVGGARRKSKNVKRSRRKSRKSRKQRKSNKNRRTKYSKK